MGYTQMNNKISMIDPKNLFDVAKWGKINLWRGWTILRNYWKNGLKLIEDIYSKKDTVNILTHCNAGWLATINLVRQHRQYIKHKKGIPVHVWVDETSYNQVNLTSYEPNEEEIPSTIIADNTGGILMQRYKLRCIVGTDRTLSNGDVCNKIGTYLKALAAHDNNVHFMLLFQVQPLIGN